MNGGQYQHSQLIIENRCLAECSDTNGTKLLTTTPRPLQGSEDIKARAERIRAWGWERCCKMLSPRLDMDIAHTNSQQLWLPPQQDLNKIKPAKIPAYITEVQSVGKSSSLGQLWRLIALSNFRIVFYASCVAKTWSSTSLFPLTYYMPSPLLWTLALQNHK